MAATLPITEIQALKHNEEVDVAIHRTKVMGNIAGAILCASFGCAVYLIRGWSVIAATLVLLFSATVFKSLGPTHEESGLASNLYCCGYVVAFLLGLHGLTAFLCVDVVVCLSAWLTFVAMV